MPESEFLEIPQPFVVRLPSLYWFDATYPQLSGDYEAEFFIYTFPAFGPMTAALTQQQQVIIQANTAFEMRNIGYHWNLANGAFTEGTRPIPNCTLQLQDSGSGKNFFSAPAPLDLVAQHGGELRRALYWPKIFAPNSTITATVTNFDAAVVNGNLRLCLIGRHLYRLAR